MSKYLLSRESRNQTSMQLPEFLCLLIFIIRSTHHDPANNGFRRFLESPQPRFELRHPLGTETEDPIKIGAYHVSLPAQPQIGAAVWSMADQGLHPYYQNCPPYEDSTMGQRTPQRRAPKFYYTIDHALP